MLLIIEKTFKLLSVGTFALLVLEYNKLVLTEKPIITNKQVSLVLVYAPVFRCVIEIRFISVKIVLSNCHEEM